MHEGYFYEIQYLCGHFLTLLASLSPAFAQVGDPGESLRPAKLMVLEEAADFVERRFSGESRPDRPLICPFGRAARLRNCLSDKASLSKRALFWDDLIAVLRTRRE
ncbi:hypothetical protein FLP41_03700 (plasmid) [Paracoccus marcusii]|nr:hypothetical protein FLP41_03700 [Paracoccus marcusii]